MERAPPISDPRPMSRAASKRACVCARCGILSAHDETPPPPPPSPDGADVSDRMWGARLSLSLSAFALRLLVVSLQKYGANLVCVCLCCLRHCLHSVSAVCAWDSVCVHVCECMWSPTKTGCASGTNNCHIHYNMKSTALSSNL